MKIYFDIIFLREVRKDIHIDDLVISIEINNKTKSK
jgi:hypothetical protein